MSIHILWRVHEANVGVQEAIAYSDCESTAR